MSSVASSHSAFCRSVMCEDAKLVLGSIAVFLLLLMVFVGVSFTYCVLKLHPAFNFLILFACVALLAYVEALHYACVSVDRWNMRECAVQYPRAIRCHALVDTPAKIKKFLMGRQFIVIFVVFFIAQITTFPDIPQHFAGVPEIIMLIFVKTGLPGVAVSLCIGQLISQIYVEEFTVQFLNLHGCELVIRMALFVENSGICHFSYLLYGTISWLFCYKMRRIQETLDSDMSMHDEPISPHTANRGVTFHRNLICGEPLNWFDYFRYGWSTCATLGSAVVVVYGIWIQAYVLPVPVACAYVLLFVLLVWLYYLEGLIIAIVGTQYWDPETFREAYPNAFALHQLMRQPENVKSFIVGRQFCTVLTNFLLAQILTFAYFPGDNYNPVLFYVVVKSGLVGVFIVLSFAQLLPELLAAEYPLRFMNMPGSYRVAKVCLLFDSVGVGHASWAIYFVTRRYFCTANDTATAAEPSRPPSIVRAPSVEVLATLGKPHRGDVVQA